MKDTVKPVGLNTWRTFRAVSALALICAAAMPVRATVYAWTNAAALTTNWNNGGKWTPAGFPNAAGDVANITNNIIGKQTIFLNQSTITVGTLNVGDAATPAYAVSITNNAIAGTLTLDNSGNPAQVSESSASPGDTIAVPVQFAAGLVISNASANTLTFSGPISGSGNIVVQTNAVTLAPAADYTLPNNILGNNNASLIKGGPATLTLMGSNNIALNVNAGIGGGGTLLIAGGLFSNQTTGAGFPFQSAGNTLIVSNAVYYAGQNSPGGTVQAGYGSASNTVLVTGSNALWNQGANIIVMAFPGDRFVIAEGAVVTNLGRIWPGSSGNGQCSLVISNGGRLFTSNSGNSYIGYNSSSNTTVIAGTNALTGAPALWDVGGGAVTLGFFTGISTNSNNMLIVGAGGILTNGSITVGGLANMTANSLVITNGGQVFTTTTDYIGNSGATNFGWIGGSNPANGTPSLWSVGGSLIVGGSAGSMGNVLRVDQGGVVTNVTGSGVSVGKVAGADGNSMSIANGGKVFSANGAAVGLGGSASNALVLSNGTLMSAGGICYVGSGGTGNAVTVTANSLWDVGIQKFYVGSGDTAVNPGVSNSVLVMTGGVITNAGGTYRMGVGAAAGANFNSLIVTNGGKFYMDSGALVVGAYSTPAPGGNNNTLTVGGGLLNCTADSFVGYASSNNAATVTGGTVWNGGGKNLTVGGSAATGNTLRVDTGAVLTNVATLMAGGASQAANNTLVIGSGGSVFASVAAAGASQAVNNVISVLPGGLLEAGTLTNGVAMGNMITNSGGIYQFATATPSIVPNGNPVAIENGIVAFRNLGTVDLRASAITNLTWIGTNAFRLNNASNTTATTQTYLFDPGFGSTNYARLEMVNGTTRYRGLNTNSLTIGQTLGSGGQMLCSNTAATVAMTFTNNGTLTIVNSTLTLTTNAVFNGAVVIDLNHLVTTSGVISAQRALVLGTNSTLAFVGTPTTNAVMLTTASGYTGRFGSVTGLPPSYSVSYAGNTVAIRYAPVSTVFFFR